LTIGYQTNYLKQSPFAVLNSCLRKNEFVITRQIDFRTLSGGYFNLRKRTVENNVDKVLINIRFFPNWPFEAKDCNDFNTIIRIYHSY